MLAPFRISDFDFVHNKFTITSRLLRLCTLYKNKQSSISILDSWDAIYTNQHDNTSTLTGGCIMDKLKQVLFLGRLIQDIIKKYHIKKIIHGACGHGSLAHIIYSFCINTTVHTYDAYDLYHDNLMHFMNASKVNKKLIISKYTIPEEGELPKFTFKKQNILNINIKNGSLFILICPTPQEKQELGIDLKMLLKCIFPNKKLEKQINKLNNKQKNKKNKKKLINLKKKKKQEDKVLLFIIRFCNEGNGLDGDAMFFNELHFLQSANVCKVLQVVPIISYLIGSWKQYYITRVGVLLEAKRSQLHKALNFFKFFE